MNCLTGRNWKTQDNDETDVRVSRTALFSFGNALEEEFFVETLLALQTRDERRER